MLVLMKVASLVSVGGVAVMIYGETHPEWRRARAKHAGRMHQEATSRTTDYGSSTIWRQLPSQAC
jgi:hypothetical protein